MTDKEPSTYNGMGEIYQGNTPLGTYRCELRPSEKGERNGILHVGNRATVLSVLMGRELSLRLEDGRFYPCRITEAGSRMEIKVGPPLLH